MRVTVTCSVMQFTHLFPDGERVFGAFVGKEGLILRFLAIALGVEDGGGDGFGSLLEAFGIFDGGGAGDAATEDAADEGVGAETIGAVILVFAFTGGVDAGDVGSLVFAVYPDAAHSVVHAGENFHGFNAGIDAAEFFVDFENAFELTVENLTGNVRDVEIHGGLVGEPELFLIHDAMDGAGGDVAGDEIAVFGIPLFEEIEALVFRNTFRGTIVAGFFRDPDTAAFTACGFAHEAELVLAGDGGGMDLDEFAVGIIDALLEESGLGGAGADDGVGGTAEDGTDAASAKNDGIGREGFDFHGAEIHGGDAAADAGIVVDSG